MKNVYLKGANSKIKNHYEKDNFRDGVVGLCDIL